MIINLSNADIIVLYETLQKNYQKELSITAGFFIAKNIKILQPIYEVIIESRNQIYEKFGTLQIDGTIRIPSDKIQEANEQLKQLSEINNSLDLNKVKLSTLQNASWTLEEIVNLYPILEEDLSEG